MTYEGAVDVEAIADPVERMSTISQINNFGQTPLQLFTRPHAARRVLGATTRATLSSHPDLVQGAHVCRLSGGRVSSMWFHSTSSATATNAAGVASPTAGAPVVSGGVAAHDSEAGAGSGNASGAGNSGAAGGASNSELDAALTGGESAACVALGSDAQLFCVAGHKIVIGAVHVSRVELCVYFTLNLGAVATLSRSFQRPSSTSTSPTVSPIARCACAFCRRRCGTRVAVRQSLCTSICTTTRRSRAPPSRTTDR